MQAYAAKVEKERKEDEAREQEAAAEQLRSGGKEKIYSTEGAKEKIYTREGQMGVWGGAEAKELKTQNNQDAKEEDKMSLPMNSQLQEHGQHGQRDGCSSTEKQKEHESLTKMPCFFWKLMGCQTSSHYQRGNGDCRGRGRSRRSRNKGV